MAELSDLQRRLYVQEVERLLKRNIDATDIKAIQNAFAQHRSAIETANLITGNSARIDRQNDVA
ncbi:MAG TPA: hypothetical protein VGK97_04635 [Spongiibacteraceae bacterium]